MTIGLSLEGVEGLLGAFPVDTWVTCPTNGKKAFPEKGPMICQGKSGQLCMWYDSENDPKAYPWRVLGSAGAFLKVIYMM